MRVDWQGRLDARGYHVTPVDRPDAGARWVGATTTAADKWTEGDAIVIFDSSVRGKAKPQEEASLITSDESDPLAAS